MISVLSVHVIQVHVTAIAVRTVKTVRKSVRWPGPQIAILLPAVNKFARAGYSYGKQQTPAVLMLFSEAPVFIKQKVIPALF